MICGVRQGEAGPEESSMEQIISGLLHEFETGKLTRRHLIQALALGVAAGPAALAAAQTPAGGSGIPPPGAPAPWKTVGLEPHSYSGFLYRRTTAFRPGFVGCEIN